MTGLQNQHNSHYMITAIKMKELIIKDLQEIAKQLEKTPTRTEYFEITSLKISRKTILKYFDSYTDAIEQAGLNKKPIYVKCDTCQKELTRTPSTLSEHNFCDHSCSAKFTNKIKPKRIKLIKECITCKKVLSNRQVKYCSIKCQADLEYNTYILAWKQDFEVGYVGKTKQLVNSIRKYMLLKHNNTCQECGWNKLHPIDQKPLVEIDHIDGDASNCKESNLRVLCPNCHSMTPTFRARNKNSARDRS